MSSIFACLNPNPHLSKEFVREQFNLGKSRGPDFAKFGQVGIQIYMGTHYNLKRDIAETDIEGPFANDIRVIYSGTFTNLDDLNVDGDNPTQALVHLYRKYGFEYMILLLKGTFSLVLLDQSVSVEHCLLYVTRSAIGISPLYVCELEEKMPLAFATERQMLTSFGSPQQFVPGTYSLYQLTNGVHQSWIPLKRNVAYHVLPAPNLSYFPNTSTSKLLERFVDATEIDDECVACMVSGGLKSAFLAELLSKKSPFKVKTFFTGFTDDHQLLPDGYAMAESLAKWVGSDHASILLSTFDYHDALERVRELVGAELKEEDLKDAAVFYSAAKWLRDFTSIKTVYLGAGLDELVGAESDTLAEIDYDKATREALLHFPYRMGLAIDRCFGHFGIEVRLPFLDQDLVDFYFRSSVYFRKDGRENVETCISHSVSMLSPFLEKSIDWKIVKCKPKSPYTSAFSKM